jgi:hypothetical protein
MNWWEVSLSFASTISVELLNVAINATNEKNPKIWHYVKCRYTPHSPYSYLFLHVFSCYEKKSTKALFMKPVAPMVKLYVPN